MNRNRLIILILTLSALLLIMLFCHTTEEYASLNQGSERPTIPDKAHTVRFYADNGTLLKLDYVHGNAAAVPPKSPEMSPGMLFCSWNQDFSRVTADMDIHPVCQNLNGIPNAFGIVSTYGESSETALIQLMLTGDVCTAGYDMILTYDPEKLVLEDTVSDDSVVYNQEAPGKVRLNYVSTENTIAEVLVCELLFRIKANSGSIPVNVEMVNIYACSDSLDSGSDVLYVPEYSLTNGNVHVIP